MWTLTLRVPDREPEEYIIKAGRTTIGRSPEQNIVVIDSSASRQHAELYFDENQGSVTVTDLGSTNGTFVNRDRLIVARRLYDGDVIRIGGSTLIMAFRDEIKVEEPVGSARRFTRELLLEALDHHAVLLYEVAHQLNVITDLDAALEKVADLMRQSMGADKCELILEDQFDNLDEIGFPTTIADDAIRGRSAIIVPDMSKSPYWKAGESSRLMQVKSALCVPVIAGDESQVLALLYMYKKAIDTRPFDESDMQLAVAISHQAALTIQRMMLITQIQEEQRGRQLLQRFLSPHEVEFMLQDYLENGQLPPLDEREVTILFADIQDSTGLAERLGAKAFGEILNRYYWDLTDMIFEFGGLVRYAGDGIMAVFGMTGDSEDHAAKAIYTGQAILDHVESIDFEIQEEIIIGVGINTGAAAVGYVGTQQRVELTALGYTVNIAHALQLLARPNRIFVGPETAVGVAGKLPLRDLGILGPKGSEQKFHAYEVVRQSKTTPKVIEL
jgi:class 3 adenylate cyclase